MVDHLLRDCPSLRSGYQLYQNLLYAVKKREIDTFKEYLNVEKTDLPEIYDRTLKTFKKFLPQIENALRYGYSNGPLECLNNHIKVLKHEMPMFFEAFTTLNYES
ncbi:transposase [Enterococcus hirae]|nr:transposase [Enterococcus hirae]